jgi:hypothetical protein
MQSNWLSGFEIISLLGKRTRINGNHTAMVASGSIAETSDSYDRYLAGDHTLRFSTCKVNTLWA